MLLKMKGGFCMSKKKDSETAKKSVPNTNKERRTRIPRMPKDALLVISRSNNENASMLFRTAADITEEEFYALLVVLQAYVDANMPEPPVEHTYFGPPPS